MRRLDGDLLIVLNDVDKGHLTPDSFHVPLQKWAFLFALCKLEGCPSAVFSPSAKAENETDFDPGARKIKRENIMGAR